MAVLATPPPTTSSIKPVFKVFSSVSPAAIKTAAAAQRTLFLGDTHGIDRKILDKAVTKTKDLTGPIFTKAIFSKGNASIRKISDRCVILEVGRKKDPKTGKSPSTLGSGAHKIVKKCYRLISNGESWRAFSVAFVKHKTNARTPTSLTNPRLENINHPNLYIIHQSHPIPQNKRVFGREAYLAPLALSDLHEIKTPLSIKDRFEIVTQLLSGLNHLHQQGLVHQDLKPENFLLSLENEKFVAQIADCDDVIKEGSPRTIGTPGFKAPESLINTLPVTFASEVFSMGMSLAEIFEPIRSSLDATAREALYTLINEMTSDAPEARPILANVIIRIEAIMRTLP